MTPFDSQYSPSISTSAAHDDGRSPNPGSKTTFLAPFIRLSTLCIFNFHAASQVTLIFGFMENSIGTSLSLRDGGLARKAIRYNGEISLGAL
jgi:hypothetical protein